ELEAPGADRLLQLGAVVDVGLRAGGEEQPGFAPVAAAASLLEKAAEGCDPGPAGEHHNRLVAVGREREPGRPDDRERQARPGFRTPRVRVAEEGRGGAAAVDRHRHGRGVCAAVVEAADREVQLAGRTLFALGRGRDRVHPRLLGRDDAADVVALAGKGAPQAAWVEAAAPELLADVPQLP